MELGIGFCGLDCNRCPIYMATIHNSDDERKKVAKMWNKKTGLNLQAGDINCDGCHADTGRQFSHCSKCVIRTCALYRNVENCGLCEEYSCGSLDSFLDPMHDNKARKRLDDINEGL